MKRARRVTRRGPDRNALRRAADLFLRATGETDLRRDMRRTPRRVADAWANDLLSGYTADPEGLLTSSFPSKDRDLVVLRDVHFVSVCVHHLLPFHGTAHVGYLPHGRLVGLSKIVQLVDALSRRLQLQERLTRQVTSAIQTALRPAGAACRIEAEHFCMTARDARRRGVRVVTSAYSGVFETRAALRSEFLRLSGAPLR
jgi:GTP cyclohydrolase I